MDLCLELNAGAKPGKTCNLMGLRGAPNIQPVRVSRWDAHRWITKLEATLKYRCEHKISHDFEGHVHAILGIARAMATVLVVVHMRSEPFETTPLFGISSMYLNGSVFYLVTALKVDLDVPERGSLEQTACLADGTRSGSFAQRR